MPIRTMSLKHPASIIKSLPAMARAWLRKARVLSGTGFSRIVSINADRSSSPSVYGIETLILGEQWRFDDDPEARAFLTIQRHVKLDNGAVRTTPVFLAELRDIFFDAKSGLVCTSDGKLILESGVDIYRIKGCSLYGSARHADDTLATGEYASIWGMYTHNHGHWLVECLPRLYSLRSVDRPIEVLMPTGLSTLQRETLECCLPSKCTIKYVDRLAIVRVKNYLFPSFATSGTAFFLLPPQYLGYIRDSIFRRYGLSGKHEHRNRIYISRRKANYRRVLNEPQLIDCLSEYGFKSYALEDLSFADQVKLFHDAEMVVSPHCAGLTNVIFADKIRVLEIFSHAPEPAFFFIIKAAGHKYFYVFAEHVIPDQFFPAWPEQRHELRAAINADFRVDIKALRQTLVRMLDHRS